MVKCYFDGARALYYQEPFNNDFNLQLQIVFLLLKQEAERFEL